MARKNETMKKTIDESERERARERKFYVKGIASKKEGFS